MNHISTSALGQLLDRVPGQIADQPLRDFSVRCVRRIWDRLEYDQDARVVAEIQKMSASYGRQLRWQGDGHFATTRLSIQPTEVLDANPELKAAIEQQRRIHESEPEILGVIRHDFYTPSFAARMAGSFRFDFFRLASIHSLLVEASPVAYWLPDYYSDFEDDSKWSEFTASFAAEWGERSLALVAEYCDLFEDCMQAAG